MKKSITIFVLLLTTLTFAQSKEEKIKELLTITNEDKITSQEAEQFVIESKKMHPNIPDEFLGDLIREINSKIISIYTPIYAEKYTDTDIDELLRFYKTPVGRKIILNLPTIFKERMQVMKEMRQAISVNTRIEEVHVENKNNITPPPPPPPSIRKKNK